MSKLSTSAIDPDFVTDSQSGRRPFVPNEKTVRAMKKARLGKVTAIDTIEALIADLYSED
jgi:hypothetical protein